MHALPWKNEKPNVFYCNTISAISELKVPHIITSNQAFFAWLPSYPHRTQLQLCDTQTRGFWCHISLYYLRYTQESLSTLSREGVNLQENLRPRFNIKSWRIWNSRLAHIPGRREWILWLKTWEYTRWVNLTQFYRRPSIVSDFLICTWVLFMFEFLNMLIAVLSPCPFTTLHRETCKIVYDMISGIQVFTFVVSNRSNVKQHWVRANILRFWN